MEADLYNLYPEIGELNGLRNNFSMAALGGPDRNPASASFGGCRVVIADRKFEPHDGSKGIVARTYLYMNSNYPGRGVISEKNQKLFEAWDQQYPVSEWECRRAEKILKIQENANELVAERCLAIRKKS